MKSAMLTIIFAVLTFVIADSDYHMCHDAKNAEGFCMPMNKCEHYANLREKQPITNETIAYVRNSQCGYENKIRWFCCPSVDATEASNKSTIMLLKASLETTAEPTTATTIKQLKGLPKTPSCGLDISDKIFGGKETALNEFPWMVLMQVIDGYDGTVTEFYCGGTLINDQYILTAAHCIPNADFTYSVRLGEHDIRSDPDCFAPPYEKICSDPHQDIKVSKAFVHEEYNIDSRNQENDIALLKLERSVEFSDSIRPICLPTEANLDNLENLVCTAVGWGITEDGQPSNTKLKIDLEIRSHNECEEVYQKYNRTIGPNQFCAGGLQSQDTCNGDSGGPVMRQNNLGMPPYWFQAGIVSYGHKDCGTHGIPGVYTKVSKFIEWIETNIQN